MIDLSIIIVCYKGWERLKKCLDSLNSFTGEDFSKEVIVVDNRSDDDTIYRIEKEYPGFRFIYNSVNGGYSNGCNLGAENASGEFILILNPDTVASESEVEKLLITARQNLSFALLSCRQVNESGKESIASGPFPHFFNLTGLQRALFGKREKEAGNQKSQYCYPDWVSGSVMLLRKELYERIGGFDDDFWMYFEDVDLCRRIRNIGGKIVFCNTVTIEHNHGGSSRINLKTSSLTKTEVHISRHLYICKHNSGTEKVLIQSFLVINNLISGGLMALLGIVFFFIPKLFARTLIFFKLISYYVRSLSRLSWISPRSVNFTKE
jgi:GT2 family glycosyltransferase